MALLLHWSYTNKHALQMILGHDNDEKVLKDSCQTRICAAALTFICAGLASQCLPGHSIKLSENIGYRSKMSAVRQASER